MLWHKVIFTFEQIEQERALLELGKKFESIYIKADGPSDMALFSDNEYRDNRINIYFTPGCSPSCDQLIAEYNGQECEAPDVEYVSIVTGNDDAEDLLATHWKPAGIIPPHLPFISTWITLLPTAEMILNSSYYLACPYCLEQIEVVVDVTAGSQEYTKDCEVCCNPILLRIKVDEETVTDIEALKENGWIIQSKQPLSSSPP